ncbi:glycosyltransferase family 4 protein [Brevundimonas sp. NIBR11]|uniref:glycosyltransferase family 4 protein n=1 Tax=Brevundimonas sp. NIBR11 TaxID=3015999 RepID=UPI0022F02D2D|nr:glycosyltransferase family 4 protein [Brevundimonas sp. NIBR11]WGM31829.1 D-inositol-3-phosphate glycosyltransferase [Brevundimonas sp. NIBR11]
MRIVLTSGHKADWDAGASSVYLNLHQQLGSLNHDTSIHHYDRYGASGAVGRLAGLVDPLLLDRVLYDEVKQADVVDVTGGLGWKLFDRLGREAGGRAPLRVCHLHGLEFKDDQARMMEEASQLLKTPLLYRLFGRHLRNWHEFRAIRNADLVICHSSREADAIQVAGLKGENQIAVVPLGVDSGPVKPRDFTVAAIRILWWGSWTERKGRAYLPRTLELIAREVPEVTLTIGGCSSEKASILRAFGPAMASRVEVLPFVSRAQQSDIMDEHDVFLFPSISEGFGLALLEAMSRGMPCVTTYTGMYDWLEHGRNCCVVPMQAPSATARQIVTLLRSPALRSALSAEAIETAHALTWRNFAEGVAQAYALHLERRTGRC